ncbi:MAG: RICIN domain-containing protein [Lachnospiraceae bacterium]|nr:RICIN domain-containing protein [Lachnospiraceae bacterium]
MTTETELPIDSETTPEPELSADPKTTSEAEVSVTPKSTPESALSVMPEPFSSEAPAGAGTVAGAVGAAASAGEAMMEGLYMFEVCPDGLTQRALAIRGNSMEDYADIITGSFTEANVRLFYIENVSGIYYRIRSLHSGKCLQVTSNKTADGTKVRQKTAGTTTAQQWIFVKSGKGYKIIGRASGKALNVAGGSADTGATLEIRTPSDAPSQVWYPRARLPMLAGAGVSVAWPDTQCYTGKEITPDVAVTIYGKKLVANADYTLAFANNVKVGMASVTVIGRNGYRGRQTGTFAIFNYKTAVESGGVYYLVPKTGTKLSLAVAGNSVKNNAALCLAERTNTKYKKFTFLKTTDGTYKILPCNSLYCLEGDDGGGIKLYKQLNNGYQRWRMVKDSSGAFSIVNRNAGLALTVRSGTAPVLAARTGADNQKFLLMKSSEEFPGETAYLGQIYNHYVELIEMTADITPKTTNTKVSIFKQEAGANGDNRCSGVYVDFARKKIGLYKGFGMNETRKSLIENDIPFDVKPGHLYQVSMVRAADCQLFFSLVDPATWDVVYLYGSFLETGRAWGKFEYKVDKGSATVTSLKERSLANTRPLLAMVGDSYIEGYALDVAQEKRYSALLLKYLKGSAYVCAKGGAKSANGVVWFNQYLFETVRPKYILLSFGMNDNDFDKWLSNMQKMIALAEENGATPILVTIPPNATETKAYMNDVHLKMSAWVRASGYRYLDVAKVLTKNHDGVTMNKALYSIDLMHPNEEGHRKIYDEFLQRFGDIR